MAHGIFRAVTFAAKGGILGLALGLGGAVFGTIIGSSFQSIWASGMPMAMAAMGVVIFGILSSIGMHNDDSGNYQKTHLNTGK